MSVLLLIGVGVLVSLLRARAGGADSASAATASAGPRPAERSEATDGGPTPIVPTPIMPTPIEADAGSVEAGGVSPPAAGAGPEAPRSGGELAALLASLSEQARACAELDEGYRPRELRVRLIRAAGARVRVSSIEPQPPPPVGACLTRLLHQATASSRLSASQVEHLIPLR